MITLITTNWGTVSETKSFLNSLQQQTLQQYQVIIVNNQPEDWNEIKELKSAKVHVYDTGENLGYAGGINYGVRQALTKHRKTNILIVINNDVILPKDFLKELKLQYDPHSIASPIILYANTTTIQNTGGTINYWLGGTRNLNKNTPLDQYQAHHPDFLSGCCLILTPTIWKKVGQFDEQFQSYYEDVDWCWRAQQLNIQPHILDSLILEHDHSASTKSLPSYKRYLLSRNTILFARKQLTFIPKLIFTTAAILRGMLMYGTNFRQAKPWCVGTWHGLTMTVNN